MTPHAPLPALPIFVKLAGRPVILLGEGEAADAKRRLLERAGASVADEGSDARLAIIALDDAAQAEAAVARLLARGVLVNAVDRPHLCDFTLPAIVDRSPVLVAIGTAGVSAGLAAALRQRLEMLLPPGLGRLAEALHAAREVLRRRLPDSRDRRHAIAAVLAPGAPLDPLTPFAGGEVAHILESAAPSARQERIAVRSADPDDLTLREARWLANADRLYHAPAMPTAILDRARADADRIAGPAPVEALPGLTVELVMA
ncbi:uroporphyrin-III C-methyltransferase / precorrin-2 dehydrogenase / sirohydrochlorin ferrochelatase [Sphingomonas gellani]|uniref:precorrin-2 dehydrogenase n=1 Tax=Sphingomonas gellani TaxID=1166340 RepID=A0A1H8CE51_9SPHN|nr:NAD(P)-dependent oxidoreductase [Sphingomonas gellani]SEM93296.1 uroporphyrin-III C-methyltransferase / precorrin-2 dehydrogenase / sirohydrochlorin ferrochelatase [Sphingomonas gellani]